MAWKNRFKSFFGFNGFPQGNRFLRRNQFKSLLKSKWFWRFLRRNDGNRFLRRNQFKSLFKSNWFWRLLCLYDSVLTPLLKLEWSESSFLSSGQNRLEWFLVYDSYNARKSGSSDLVWTCMMLMVSCCRILDVWICRNSLKDRMVWFVS